MGYNSTATVFYGIPDIIDRDDVYSIIEGHDDLDIVFSGNAVLGECQQAIAIKVSITSIYECDGFGPFIPIQDTSAWDMLLQPVCDKLGIKCEPRWHIAACYG